MCQFVVIDDWFCMTKMYIIFPRKNHSLVFVSRKYAMVISPPVASCLNFNVS